jgi:hypothetical protein
VAPFQSGAVSLQKKSAIFLQGKRYDTINLAAATQREVNVAKIEVSVQ